jgi:hypothetical protein
MPRLNLAPIGLVTRPPGRVVLTPTPPIADRPPMSFDDPIFVAATPGVVGQLLNIGSALADKSFANENNGAPIIIMLGSNTISRCRFGLPTREGPRIAGLGTFLFDQCWIECDGNDAAGDHADCIQAYSPGDSGTLFLNNSTVRAYRSGDGPIGAGSVGVFLADNWTGTFKCRNVIFWSGNFGCRAFPDAGGDMHIDFEDVFFVGPFQNDAFSIGQSIGGHVTVIDRWVNVRDATIVGGQLVPGALIPAPIPDPLPPSPFPDASNTGYPPGTVFTLVDNQLFRSSSDGQIIENLHLTDSDMIVTHDNVTIRNCWFDSAVANNALRVFDGGDGPANGVLIHDCTFAGHANCTNAMQLNGLTGATVQRCDISGCDNGVNVGTHNTLVEDCYIHDLNNTVAGDPHYDCIEVNGGLDNLVVRHCTLINLQSQTSCINLNNFFGASASNSQLVDDCKLIDGGSSPIYSDGRFVPAQPMQNVTIQNCIIRPSALWGYTALVYNTINWQWINNRDEGGNVLPDPGVNP